MTYKNKDLIAVTRQKGEADERCYFGYYIRKCSSNNHTVCIYNGDWWTFEYATNGEITPINRIGYLPYVARMVLIRGPYTWGLD